VSFERAALASGIMASGDFHFKAPHVGVGQPRLESIMLVINRRSLCRDF
jgi:hypothetical protein